ncbi:hypothetical protein PsWM33_01492 [Pseudovibrio sp. WM33]|nr:hypothetical protein PsWM33_01492 [Pseudovibrio sp. WM33]
MLTRQITPMTPFSESSSQTNDRPKSHITLIRKSQEKALDDMQWEFFCEQVVQKLMQDKKCGQLTFKSVSEVRSFVKAQLQSADEKGIKKQSDLYDYVVKILKDVNSQNVNRALGVT